MEDFFRLTYVDQGLDDDACGEQIDDLQWRLDADGLHLHVVTIHDGPPVENTALYEAKPWQQVEEWSEGLPPNGIWMVELSVDDFVERGMLRSVAERDWAGTYIFTLADGEFSFTWISNWGFVAGCRASYQGVGDIVRFTYHRNTLCEGEVTDAQWRLDSEGGLAFHVVELITGEKEIRGIWEAQPWRKISD